MEVTWIRDNAGPRLMERSLFPDAPDSLITALGSTESRLPTALAAMGISADEVDCIFLTHLHGDHIGGMLKDGKAAFPNAEVYVSKTEYDGWAEMPADKNGQVMETMDIYGNRLHLFSENDSLPVQKQGS